jgi:internalin A
MKVKKLPQLNMNPVFTLSGVRPLATLAFFLFVSSCSARAILFQQTTNPRTFADWCLDRNNLSVETLHTIDVLLKVAKTQDCHQAGNLLSTRTELDLNDNQIADLRPLSALTNLTSLYLANNQIADLKPLSTLTNLTNLLVINNQIADLKPLLTLTNLTYLDLGSNQTFTDKTCHVKPKSVCCF